MKKNNKKGFTLAELLVVVAILAILVAIAIPVFNGATKKAEVATVKANLRSVYAEAVVATLSDQALTTVSYTDEKGAVYSAAADSSAPDGIKISCTIGDGYKNLGTTATYNGTTFTGLS